VDDDSCDDGNNNEKCNYDGGDCCGNDVNTEYCDECQCLEDGVTTPQGSTDDFTQGIRVGK
jgi:hypothetical protein